MPFHLESPWGTTCPRNAAYRGCTMYWGRNKILMRVGKNSGPILSSLWTKVHEILGLCRDPLYFPTSLPDCLCPFVQKLFEDKDIKSRGRQKTNKCESVLATNFWKGSPRPFYGRLLARFTVHHVGKFG